MGRIYRAIEVSGDERESSGKKEIAVAIIDTGADVTVISQNLANRINAELYGTLQAVCASQVVLEGRYADVFIKEIRGRKQTTLRAGVSNIPFDTDDIDDEGADVILGPDFIQKTGLTIRCE
jgi:predicted aspartyl protease